MSKTTKFGKKTQGILEINQIEDLNLAQFCQIKNHYMEDTILIVDR
jgi:hypothetical protein